MLSGFILWVSWQSIHPLLKYFILYQSVGPTDRHCHPQGHAASMAKNEQHKCLGKLLKLRCVLTKHTLYPRHLILYVVYIQWSNYPSLLHQVSQKCLLLSHPEGYSFSLHLDPNTLHLPLVSHSPHRRQDNCIIVVKLEY